ncbi:MAG: glucose-6-phosphate isomerase [Arcobacter sp.]|nr:MAG: glucose-6-phosphate isomerase [Arcobacter sp.]
MNEKRDKLFNKLKQLKEQVDKSTINEMFTLNPERFNEFSTSCKDMVLDYSKVHIDKAIKKTLIELAGVCKLEEKREAMYRGDRINITENRAVLHIALRNQSNEPIYVDGKDIMPDINESLSKMKAFSDGIREGSILSSCGKKFKNVVNIGIGGSHLGPSMVTKALKPYHDGPTIHFVSNIDSSHIYDVLNTLDPSDTLILVASKTFVTIETMTNAKTALKWMIKGVGENGAKEHFVAISTAHEKTKEFGIKEERVFGYWDWVGGRYSIWSAIGLGVMIAIGMKNFTEFLEGAYEMDQHFKNTPLEENIPVLLALVGIWHINICDYSTRALLPYDQRLSSFPSYIQQLDMESNGKSISSNGDSIHVRTGAVVWGDAGTNSQHSFFQLLHQGSEIVPCEFLVAVNKHEKDMDEHNNLLLANCLAQSQALMAGRRLDEVIKVLKKRGVSHEEAIRLAPHRQFKGNRPSTTLMYKKLDPKTLGKIIALYEHRVFVEGVIWGVDSFDQWGVELGKELATEMLSLVVGDKKVNEEELDSSSAGLLKNISKWSESL